MQTYAAQRGQVRAVTDHRQHDVRVPTLGSTMSVPDMEADENGAGREHTGGWSQRDESEAYWCPQPDWEADPGAFPGRMTVAPPPGGEHAGATGVSHAPLAGCPYARGARSMHVLYPRCCGVDMHQTTVVACVRLTDPEGTSLRFVRTCG